MVKVHRFPELKRYYSNVTSIAFYINIIVLTLAIFLPIIVCCVTLGFYSKSFTYYERPDTTFDSQLFLNLQTPTGNIMYTNIRRPVFSGGAHTDKRFRIPLIRYHKKTISSSKKVSYLGLTIQMPLQPFELVESVLLVLFMPVRLYRYTRIESIHPVLLSASTLDDCGGVSVSANVQLEQAKVLPSIGTLNRSTEHLSWILQFGDDPSSEGLDKLLLSFSREPVLPTLQVTQLRWKPFSPASLTFDLEVMINVTWNRISTQPGFWFTLKFAWLQYFPVAVCFLYLANKLRSYLYALRWISVASETTLLKHLRKSKMD